MTCFNCSNAVAVDMSNTRNIDGETQCFCNTCYELFRACGNCSDSFPRVSTTFYPVYSLRSSGVRYTSQWCGECADESATVCYSCDHRFDQHRISMFEYDDEQYCESCYDNLDRYDEDEFDPDYEEERNGGRNGIYDYNADPIRMSGISPDPDKLNLGFEIEVEIESRRGGTSEALDVLYKRSNRKVIAKSDGSISYGFEMVSIARPLDEMKALVDEIFFDGLHASINSEAHSVGMHVHISRAVLSRSQMAKMIMFTQANGTADFMDFIAGRDLRNHSYCSNTGRMSWKDVLNGSQSQGRKISKFVKTFSPRMRSTPDRPNEESDSRRYSALNFNRRPTVEYRIFQSSNDAARIKANLEFAAALPEFCAQSSRPLSHFGTPVEFVKFVSGRKEFSNLAARFVGTRWVSTEAKPDLRSIRRVMEGNSSARERADRPRPWWETIAEPVVVASTVSAEDMAWIRMTTANRRYATATS